MVESWWFSLSLSAMETEAECLRRLSSAGIMLFRGGDRSKGVLEMVDVGEDG